MPPMTKGMAQERIKELLRMLRRRDDKLVEVCEQRDELLAAAWDMVAACYAPRNVPVYEWRQKAINKLKELSDWPEPIAKAEGK